MMEILKKIEDIEFTKKDVYGETMGVSEPIVMASAAGWYVGAICESEYGVEPFHRYTEYMSKEQAKTALENQFIFESKIVPKTI